MVVIKFSVPHPEQVTISVYDLIGHKISPSVERRIESGTQHILWNTQNLAIGNYILKAGTGTNTLVKRITILR
jgi:hypothetical protein